MDRCLVYGPLSPGEAKKRFHVMMARMRDELLDLGVERVARVTWRLDESTRDKDRHFAATEGDGREIVSSAELFRLPEDHHEAILKHEWGHAVDFLYPAEIDSVVDGELRTKAPTAAMVAAWKGRSKDAIERAADQLAEAFWGETMRYAGSCQLQSFERGRAGRPRGLR
jgi:hypothetical protein